MFGANDKSIQEPTKTIPVKAYKKLQFLGPRHVFQGAGRAVSIASPNWLMFVYVLMQYVCTNWM